MQDAAELAERPLATSPSAAHEVRLTLATAPDSRAQPLASRLEARNEPVEERLAACAGTPTTSSASRPSRSERIIVSPPLD